MATSVQIHQSSVLLPNYQVLYRFLATHAPRVAAEVQRAYINAARLYYETAFRRYVRELKRILARWREPATTLANAYTIDEGRSGVTAHAPCGYELDRVRYARIDDAPRVVLAYMAEDPTFRASPENLFHTLSLVLVDNACSEYTFLARFFAGAAAPASDAVAHGDAAQAQPPSAPSITSLSADEAEQHAPNRMVTNESWRQVMEPALSYWHELWDAILQMQPMPVLELLVTASLVDALTELARARGCLSPDFESALLRYQIEAWPHVSRALDAELDAIKLVSVGERLQADAPAAKPQTLFERWGGAALGSSAVDLLTKGRNVAATLRKVRCAPTSLLMADTCALRGAVRRDCEARAGAARGVAAREVRRAGEHTDSSFGRIRVEVQRLVREYNANVWQKHPGASSDAPQSLCKDVQQQLAGHPKEAEAWAHFGGDFAR